MTAVRMQFSSLPINSSLQNNRRYQFSLESENIEILPILSAAILKMAAIRMQFSSLPINSSLQNIPRYQFSLNSENIEILSILSGAIRSRFFLVQIFYQPYLIYMPSLVEIPSAVSDISEVNDFDICSRFPWKRRPFWKFQDLNAPLEMEIHFPVKFSKDRIISLWEFGRTSSFGEEEEE
jgi:hypothetical protein